MPVRRCLLAVRCASEDNSGDEFKYACVALEWHFAGTPQHQLVTRSRQFPGHMRADVQVAIDKLFASPQHFFGIHEENRYETLTFAALLKTGRNTPPSRRRSITTSTSAKRAGKMPLQRIVAVPGPASSATRSLLSFHREYGDEAGAAHRDGGARGRGRRRAGATRFAELEVAVTMPRAPTAARSFHSNGGADYRGRSQRRDGAPAADGRTRRGHSARTDAEAARSQRDPDFVGNRAALRELGQSTRKGILLYGPPGTGKTHTIRYLATNLPGHTTLIITAEQVGLLGALHEPRAPAAAGDGGDRGRRPDRPRPRGRWAAPARSRCSTRCSTRWTG